MGLTVTKPMLAAAFVGGLAWQGPVANEVVEVGGERVTTVAVSLDSSAGGRRRPGRGASDIARAIESRLDEKLHEWDMWTAARSDVLATFFRGATPESVEPFLGSPQLLLHAARYADRAEVVKYLIASGFDPNGRVSRGVRQDPSIVDRPPPLGPLHFAAQHNPNESVVEALVKGGADVNAVGGWFLRRPLHFAAGSNNAAVVLTLIRNGAEVNAVNGRVSGTDFRSPNLNGNRALHEAACNDDAVIDALVYAGADVASTNSSGFAALHFAVLCKRTKSISTLLAHGADANAVVEFVEEDADMHECTGCNSIHLLVHSLTESEQIDLEGLEPTLTLLVAAGVDVNSEVESWPSWVRSGMYAGYRPLRLAVEAQLGPTVVAWLLRFGALPDGASLHALFDETFQYAGYPGGFGQRSIGTEDDLRVLDLLLAEGGDVNARDRCGRTLLHRAASLAHRDRVGAGRLVESLIAAGADVNARLQDRIQELEDEGLIVMTDTGVTFDSDTDQDVLDVAEACASRGRAAFTPLHAVAKHGEAGYAIASMLVVAGADASVPDAEGETAVDVATGDRMKALLGGR